MPCKSGSVKGERQSLRDKIILKGVSSWPARRIELMKKRFIIILLALCVLFGMTTVSAMAAGNNATPSAAAVYINGNKVSFEAYTINGSNYFKMRDLAMAFNSTNKKFNISYNNSTNTVEITVDKDYVPAGGELAPGDGTSKIASPGSATIHWVEASSNAGTNYNIALGTYVINGNNFVKLRDLMQWVNVGVGYDSKAASIIINTNQNYVLPKYIGNPLLAAEAIDNKYRNDYGAQPGSIQNSGELVYKDGWYYTMGYKIKEGGQAVAYKSDYGDYIADNWQVYGNQVFFEGAYAPSMTTQVVFSMNLDGSGLKQIINDALYTGQRFTIYKGKLYANTYGGSDGSNTSIVSYNLDGTGRTVLYTGDLCVIPKSVGYGHRGYHIFNDRIYYMTRNRQVYSMKLDGSDQQLAATLHNTPIHIVNVYDGYIYYETRSEGLHRIKTDGTDDLCVLPESADQYAIYGDKVVYNIDATMVGVVNSDGTGRYQFPNAKQDPNKTTQSFWSNLFVLNSKYTFTQNVIFNNDSAVPGHIRLVADYSDPNDNDIRGSRGWFPTTVPYVNTLQDITSTGSTPASDKTPASSVTIASGETLDDGTYYIKASKNTKFGIDVTGSSKEDGAKLIVYTIAGQNNQKFKITKVGDNKYTIQCVHSGKWWSSSGTKGQQLTQSGSTNGNSAITFTIKKQADGFYRIIDSQGLYVGISSAKVANGTSVILWTEASDESQTYVFEKL